MKWLPTRKNKIEAFWNWFAENEDTYFRLHAENREQLFDLLHRKLQKVNKHLAFEFSEKTERGKRQFVISADGMLDAFDAVFDLSEAAPDLAFFEIIAFRQPSAEEFSIQFGSGELGWDDVYYTALHDIEQEEVNLKLYVKGLTKDNEEDVIQAVFILLDSVIGEYNMGVHAGTIEFYPYEAQPNTRPIHTVKEYFPIESI